MTKEFYDDQKRVIGLDSVYIKLASYFYSEYIDCKKNLSETCKHMVKNVLGGNVLHVGKGIDAIDRKNDYAIFVRVDAIRSATKKDGSHKAYNSSVLTFMWFDNDLNNLAGKIQDHLSQISWDDLAENFYD